MNIDPSQPLLPRPVRSGEASPGGRPAQDPVETSRGSRARDLYQPVAPRQGDEPARASHAGPDRIELSSAGRDIGAVSAREGSESALERAERLAELARELTEGRLFSSERLRLAAGRMLGDS